MSLKSCEFCASSTPNIGEGGVREKMKYNNGMLVAVEANGPMQKLSMFVVHCRLSTRRAAKNVMKGPIHFMRYFLIEKPNKALLL